MSETYKFGQVLSANSLSEELDMSRTPVLEAFKLLESEGIVGVVPQVGVMVRPLDPDRVFGIFTLRAILEGYVASEAAKTASFEAGNQAVKLIEEMEQCVYKEDVDGYAELNIKFHQLLVEMIDNRYLKDMITQLWDLSHYFTAKRFIFTEDLQQSLKEHRDCIDAIAAGDPEKARSIMEQHNYRLREKILRLLNN